MAQLELVFNKREDRGQNHPGRKIEKPEFPEEPNKQKSHDRYSFAEL